MIGPWAWMLVGSALGAEGSGVLEGMVLDGDRYRSIEGATLRADLPGDDDPAVRTDSNGRFLLEVPSGTWPVVLTLASGAQNVLGSVRIEDDATTELIVSWLVSWPPVVSVEEPPARAVVVAEEGVVLGTLQGIVRDEAGAPVLGARVFARGQPVDATTRKDGSFVLQLPVGPHDLTVIRTGYATRSLPGLVVTEEGGEPVEIGMVEAGLTMDAFTVTAPRVVGSTAGLLEERRQSSGVTETLGAEQMRKSGDSNAAAALRRVTGLTVVGGRFVFVRGLGDRYSSTLLNGSFLPSPEPERRTVPLDLFPTSVLESVVIQKTFTPDRTGEFGGGIVQIRTRSVPTKPILQVSGNIGYVHGATGQSALMNQRGPTDALGFGLGARPLPQGIVDLGDQKLQGRGILNPDGLDTEQLQAIGRTFPNRWERTPQTVLPDGALQLAWGDSWQVPGKAGPRIGVLLSGNWSSGWDLDEGVRNVFQVSSGETVLQRATTYSVVQNRVNLGGIAVLGANWGKDHEVASTTLINRISQYESGTFDQDDPTSDADRRNVRMTWTEQQLVYEQLRGHHVLSKRYPAVLDWRYAFSQANRGEPERLDYTLAKTTDGGYFASPTGTWNEINYGGLTDTVHEAGLDFSFPFLQQLKRPGVVKVGGVAMVRDRAADLRRFGFNLKGNEIDLTQPIDQLFAPENIGPSGEGDRSYFEITEYRVSTDDYTAHQDLFAGYAMAEVPFLKRLRLMAGARLESSDQRVSTFELNTPELVPAEARLTTLDVLPAATLTVAVGPKGKSESMLVRLGYGRTVSRPEFREMAPVPYIDPRTGTITFGYDQLRRATIDNVDLRWEWYFRPGESVSVAGFYKDFIDPIETVSLPIAGSNISQSLRNAPGARNLGVEVDFRLGWGIFHPKIADFFIAGNAAYIDSRIRIGDEDSIDTSSERPLQGQSPWVVNAQLGYDNPDLGLSVTLLYNVFGRRLVDVGQKGIPDTYEEPVHRLDLVALAPLTKGFQLQLRANNLLDWPIQQTVGSELADEVRDGFAIRLGLQWNR